MSDIASVLKLEIARVARREIRAHLEPFKKSNVQHKAQIAALRSEVVALKGQIKELKRYSKQMEMPSSSEPTKATRNRFTAKGFGSLRSRLGLSMVDMGTLIGASDQSVRKWEDGTAVPREKYQKVIFDLRNVGRREIISRLEKIAKG